MRIFKLIKEYPDSPKIGTKVAKFPTRNDNPGIFYSEFYIEDGIIEKKYGEYSYGQELIENQKEYWEEIILSTN